MAERNLKDKTVKGVSWSLIDNIANKGISFLVGLVLARLLSPEEYGLIGIVMIFISVFDSIVDSGFSNALIRKHNADDTDFNTVFWSNMALSVVLCVTLFFCANPIAHFFKMEQLKPLTEVMSSIVIINAFAIIQRTILVKRIDFKTQTKISVIASVSSGVIGIGMALAGCGVWSLVGQQISRQVLNTVFLWVFNKWYPKLVFSWNRFKELFNFGWKILVTGLINTIWKEVYQVVIGKFYSPATLGQYTRAHQFGSIFSTNITAVIQRVSYPVLSSIQEDKARLKSAYQRIIKLAMFVTFILMLGLAGISKNFVYVLVGPKWMGCVPMLQILCFSLMLHPLHAINLNMLQVQGRSDLFLILEIIKKTIAIGPLLLGIFVNIYWMLIGGVIAGLIDYFLNAFFSGKFINYSIPEQIKDITPSFIAGLISGILMFVIGLIPGSSFVILPLQLIAGASVAILLSKLMKISEYDELKKIAIEYIAKIRHRN